MATLPKNDRAIKGATCPEGVRQQVYYIEKEPNLILTVSNTRNGVTKRWSVKYTKRITGRQKTSSAPLGGTSRFVR